MNADRMTHVQSILEQLDSIVTAEEPVRRQRQINRSFFPVLFVRSKVNNTRVGIAKMQNSACIFECYTKRNVLYVGSSRWPTGVRDVYCLYDDVFGADMDRRVAVIKIKSNHPLEY